LQSVIKELAYKRREERYENKGHGQEV